MGSGQAAPSQADADLRRATNAAIQRVTGDIESFKLNTAISALMELRNAIEKAAAAGARTREAIETLVQLLNPFAPHLAEELWERLGHQEMLARTPWPRHDPALLKEDQVTLVLQVNGKVRSHLTLPAGAGQEEIKQRALADPAVQKWLSGKPPKNLIVVPNRLVNVVC